MYLGFGNMPFRVTVRFAVDLLSQDYYFLLVVIFLLIHILYCLCRTPKIFLLLENVLLFLLQVKRQRKIMFYPRDQSVMLIQSCLLMDALRAAVFLTLPGLACPREE